MIGCFVTSLTSVQPILMQSAKIILFSEADYDEIDYW